MFTEAFTFAVNDVDRRARTLAAVADPTRLRIVDALMLGDASPSDFASMLAVSSNLLSHHLGILEQAGLVARHRSEADRRRSYLRLVPDAMLGLLPVGEDPKYSPGTGRHRPATRLVFVCTANSARSQLAAALWAQNSPIPVSSGGTHPAAAIAPGAVAAAERHLLPLSPVPPQPLPDLETLTGDDYVITVCDNAYEQLRRTHAVADVAHTLHWSIPDPVPAASDDTFEAAYADIEGRVRTLAHYLAPATG